MIGRHGYSLEKREKFQNVGLGRRDSGAEPLAKLGGILPQREPIEKNLWILEPNRQPLADFLGQPAITFTSSDTSYNQFKLTLQTQNGGTQNLIIRASPQFFHPANRGGLVVELQLFGGEHPRRAPTNVVVEDVGMDERHATVSTCTSNRGRAGVRFQFFIYDHLFV